MSHKTNSFKMVNFQHKHNAGASTRLHNGTNFIFNGYCSIFQIFCINLPIMQLTKQKLSQVSTILSNYIRARSPIPFSYFKNFFDLAINHHAALNASLRQSSYNTCNKLLNKLKENSPSSWILRIICIQRASKIQTSTSYDFHVCIFDRIPKIFELMHLNSINSAIFSLLFFFLNSLIFWQL